MHKTVAHYSSGTKWLHWLISTCVFFLLLGFFLDDLTTQIKPTAVMLHRSLGLTVLILMMIRLYWIHHRGRPVLPASVPYWEVLFSRIVQYALYFFLLAMPCSGWIMSVLSNRIPRYFGLFPVPLPGIVPNKALADVFFSIHQTIAWILMVLIVLHIAGAVKHALIDRDQVLQSMLPE